MAVWFWYFMCYSFLGFVLEVFYARATRSSKLDRKCLFLLPLCPVYGLGALFILALPTPVREQPLLLVPAAALLCTAVEYLMGLFYEKVTLVSFWDYSHLRGNVGGKICPAFSAAWGVLAAVVAYLIHPVVARLVPLIPPAVTVTTALALSADSLLSVVLLRRARSAQVLRWYDRLPHPFRPVRT